MRVVRWFILALLVLSNIGISAQNLIPVGGGIPMSAGITSGTKSYNGLLYAADAYNIYTWDGVSWTDINISADKPILCMEVYNNELYVGGWFETFNGLDVNRIIKYDGVNWTPVDSGLFVAAGITGGAEYMKVHDNKLIVIGGFNQAGSLPVNKIASWDGFQWEALGTGIANFSSAPSMCSDGTDLYVCSQMTEAGGTAVSNVARWDGQNWYSLGNGISQKPTACTTHGGELYVGCKGGGSSSNTALLKWNGVIWDTLESCINGFGGEVRALKVHLGSIYASGEFYEFDCSVAYNVAKYDGVNWSIVHNGIGQIGLGIASGNFYTEHNGDLYLTGDFIESDTNYVHHVVRLDQPTIGMLGSHDALIQKKQLIVYPNPSNGIICLSGLDSPSGVLKVYDQAGKLCFNEFVSTSHKLILTDLDSGTYFLNYKGSEANTYTGKLVIVK